MRRTLRRKPASTYHHGDLRRALVDAALELLDEAGLEALSTRALARRLGVSHAAPAHHFADKEALLGAVAREAFQRFTAVLEEAGAEEDPRRRVLGIGRAYVRFAAEHPARFRVMFGRGEAGRGGAIEDSVAEALECYGVLRRAVAALLGVELAHPSVDELSFTAWSLVHGLATLWTDGTARGLYPSREDFDEAVARALDRAIEGLRPEA